MMDYEEFKVNLMDYVTEEIDNRGLEDISLKFQEIDSPDGVTDRLMVSIGDSKMSMEFRLQQIFDTVQKGELIEDAAYNVVDTIEENITVCKTKQHEIKDWITDYDNVKDHTYLRMIPGDSPILAHTPHKKFEDMALVVNFHVDSLTDSNGRSCVVVSDELMSLYGVDEKQLFSTAEINSVVNEPLNLVPLVDMIKSITDVEVSSDEVPVTYVASNKSGFQGAAVLGYPDFCEKAAEALGGSFYLLPSSVHEFILVKDDGLRYAKDLNAMVKNVNMTVLEPRDILSEQCYHYDAKAKILETGLKYDEKRHEKEQKKNRDAR